MKESFYFSHDFNARNDPKLVRLQKEKGQAGKGVFWDLIEMLYEQGGYLDISQCDDYAFAMRTDCELLKSVINDFDLFKIRGKKFFSTSVLTRTKKRQKKTISAQNSANARWHKVSSDANAMRTQCDGNAIKERKGKDIKDINQNYSAIQIFVESFQSNQIWLEMVCMKFSITEIEAKKFLDQFGLFLKTTQNVKHESKDFASHFINWMAKQKSNNIQTADKIDYGIGN